MRSLRRNKAKIASTIGSSPESTDTIATLPPVVAVEKLS